MRQSPCCARCSRAIRPSKAPSIHPVAWISSRGRRSVRHRRSGSPPGAHRPAGDGWLASAYNTTPERFGEGLTQLAAALLKEGRAEPVPHAIATAWLYVTEDIRRAEHVLADVLAPLLGRAVEQLQSLSLPIGPAEVCAERLAAFADAGAQRLFVWPLCDEVRQIELFRERVVPMLR